MGLADAAGDRIGSITSRIALLCAHFDPKVVDMYTVVTVGSSQSRIVGGRFVTPRGYTWAQ